MVISGLGVLGLTAIVMFGLCSVGIIGGTIVARVRHARYMRVFNADVAIPPTRKLAN